MSDTADWLSVKPGSLTRTPVSPEMALEEEGIRLAAPERWPASAGGAVPVCGTTQFGARRRDFPSDIWDDVIVVVLDAGRNQLAAGRLGSDYSPATRGEGDEGDEPVERPATPGPRTIIRDYVACEYGNFDLVEAVGLPMRPGTLHVFAMLGPHVSNTATIVLEPEEDDA